VPPIRSPVYGCSGALLLSALLSLHPSALAAQEPLRNELAAVLAVDSARAAAPAHGVPQALHALYDPTGAPLLWSTAGQLTSQAQALLRELGRADAYGLEPPDYGIAGTVNLVPAEGTSAADPAWARLVDVQLSAAALHFLSDLHYGRVDPAAAGFELRAAHQPIDLTSALLKLAHDADVLATIHAAEPPFHHYQLLKEALVRYLSLAQHPQLTNLPVPPAHLHRGDHYAGAAALRALLLALGDLPATAAPAQDGIFDTAASAGLRAFQTRHGLSADGLLGKATYAALTTPLQQRVRQIDLTLERWRWLPVFQTPPIIVNIPQFRLFAFHTTEDRVADILQMDVIVGRTFPHMQTPVFEAEMRYLVFRPYWDVPYSITQNEMLPKIRVNPDYLASQHLEIVRGQQDSSPTVPATAANIAALAAGQLRLRQAPGEDNALGLVKFIFPNTYNVYLHSTPAHQLFKETRRAFSHGCIRVSDPLALAQYVLRGAPDDWSAAKISAALNGAATLRVNLPQPINVLILYGTALATEAGPTLFFDDIYGYDRRLEHELGLTAIR
jgi:murein L,D-transpeptidase YcbB/YkuD